MEAVHSVNSFLYLYSILLSYIGSVFHLSFCVVSVNYVTVTIIKLENFRSPVIYQLSGKLTLWQAGRLTSVRAQVTLFCACYNFPAPMTNV